MPQKLTTEILAELDETPVGKWALRKRLTKTTKENGIVIYSIREYAPRPVPIMKENLAEIQEYVPARGIDLTEEELKSICESLRISLYHSRHIENPQKSLEDLLEDLEEAGNTEQSDFTKEIDMDDDSRDDPVPEYDYTRELDMEVYISIATYGKNRKTVKELNMVSWHDQPIQYDIREFTKKINSRGYEEVVPELDKGIVLSDYEAEILCQAIEKMFPAVLKNTAKYREEISDNLFTSVPLNLSEKEKELADKAIEVTVAIKFEDSLSAVNDGFSIGDRDTQQYLTYLGMLKRKMDNNERMYDSEIYECEKIFYTVCEWTDDVNERKAFETLGAKLDDILIKRNRLPSNKVKMGFLKRLIASAGEFETASEILQLIYNEIYYNPNPTPREKYLQTQINELVNNMIETRYEDYPNFPTTDKKEYGKKFLQLIIQSMASDYLPHVRGG